MTGRAPSSVASCFAISCARLAQTANPSAENRANIDSYGTSWPSKWVSSVTP